MRGVKLDLIKINGILLPLLASHTREMMMTGLMTIYILYAMKNYAEYLESINVKDKNTPLLLQPSKVGKHPC